MKIWEKLISIGDRVIRARVNYIGENTYNPSIEIIEPSDYGENGNFIPAQSLCIAGKGLNNIKDLLVDVLKQSCAESTKQITL